MISMGTNRTDRSWHAKFLACSGKTLLTKQVISFSTCLGGHKTLGNKLFIRECYLEMRRVIAMEFNLDPETLKHKESTQTCDQIIFTGTPGIGKSCEVTSYFFSFSGLVSK